MDKIKDFVRSYREQLAYLFFGGVSTVVNIGTYAVLHTGLGMDSDLANAIAWAIAVAIAYWTNRRWVFRSRTRGKALLREALTFVGGRVATGLMDEFIMHMAVEVIGPRMIPASARVLWDVGVKVFSNVLVIILNYFLSKRVIFK